MWRGFTEESFQLLDKYKANDNPENYKSEEFDPLIRDQFKHIRDIAFPVIKELLSEYDLTDKHALSKHVSRGNKLYHHFWAAVYRQSKESKTKDVQLFWRIDPDRFSFGFYVGHEMDNAIFKDIQSNISKNHDEIIKLVSGIKLPRELTYANDDTHGFLERKMTHAEAFSSEYWAEGKSPNLYFNYSRSEIVSKGPKLIDEIIEGFKVLAKLYSMLITPSSKSPQKPLVNRSLENRIRLTPKMSQNNFEGSKNIILYGAPGTGKTYNTKKLALEIIGEDFESEEFLDIYDKAIISERISFVTFHPNFGYENFVEGIFPNVEAKEGLRYVEKNGVFKEIVAKALKDLLIPVQQNNNVLPFEDAYEQFVDYLNDKGGSVELSTLAHEKKFTVSESETGGLAFTTGSGNVFHCAEKKLKRIFDSLVRRSIFNPDRSDILEDRSLVAYSVVVLRMVLGYAKVGSESKATKQSSHYDPFELLASGMYKINPEPQRFVLIIDEINRGNIPAIFGELITLIEDSKRIGSKEKTMVTLPLSQGKFGVPSNLFLVGTMNTADRSVEALDIALRRRFEFREMHPEYDSVELLPDLDGISIVKMLRTINDRIIILKGKDYVIGHSYFIDLDSVSGLRHVFKNKVIPLLEEYFYGEMGKIKLILGNTFVKNKFSNSDLARLKISSEIDVTEVLGVTNMDDWNFKSIYE
jgi:hypothetical protein